MLKTRAHRRGLVAALLGVSVGLVNVGCLSSGPAASSTVTGAARETVAPPEAPTPWGLTPDIRVSVEEWAEFIGAVPVDSVEAARRQVAFEVALPDQLAGMPRSHLFVTSSGGATAEVLDTDGVSSSYTPPAPALEERVVYAFYGDIGVYVGPSGWPATVDAAQVEEEFIEGLLSGTGMRETRSVLSVNSFKAVGWSQGTHHVRSENPEQEAGFDVVYTNSVVTWIQEGVQLSVSSFSRTHDELLPCAEEVAREYEAR